LFTPKITIYDKIKIIKNEICLNHYCNKIENSSNEIKKKDENKINNEKEKILKNDILLVNYESITNYITEYDAFCDYDSFFGKLTTIINLGRIIGNIVYSYISDKYGRLVSFNYNLKITVVFYVLILIFRNRLFFYLFMFEISLNINLYFLIICMGSETMNQKYFSLLNSAMSAIFSLSGIVCLVLMILIKDFYYLLLIQLIIIIPIIYYSKTYILESFSFSIKKNNFQQVLNNFYYLNELLGLKLRNNSEINNKLEKLEVFTQNFLNKQNLLYNDSTSNDKLKVGEKKLDIQKKIQLVEIDDFYNNNKKAHLLSNKSFNKEFIFNSDNLYSNTNTGSKNEFLQKIDKSTVIEISSKISNDQKQNNTQINDYKDKKEKKMIKNDTDSSFQNILNSLHKNSKVIFGPYMDILTSKTHILTYLKFLPIFITINVIYYGQLFNVEKLSGDVYIATFIIFSSELGGELIAAIILQYSDRKKVLFNCLICNGVLYFLAIFSNNVILRYFVTFGGSVSISVAFIAVYIYTAETFEVEVKNSMGALLNISSVLFMVFFPYIVELFPNIFVLFSSICFLSIGLMKKNFMDNDKEQN